MRHKLSHFQKQLVKQWIEAMGERPGRPIADPVTHQVVEFLASDESQCLALTCSNQILLIDWNGNKLRTYGAHQREQALTDWRKWR